MRAVIPASVPVFEQEHARSKELEASTAGLEQEKAGSTAPKELAATAASDPLQGPIEEEYIEDIITSMHGQEERTRAVARAIDLQPEIRWHLRPIATDYIVECHADLRLCQELLSITALLMAAKLLDLSNTAYVEMFVRYCGGLYAENQLLQMEHDVAYVVEWDFQHPTAETWLSLYCWSPGSVEMEVQDAARFMMELTLYYREFVSYPSSAIALGCLALAHDVYGKDRVERHEHTMKPAQT
ncbi:cyclin-like protein [Heliocybe sulcata]|uniref:Cyclin-like protein n=1 Tax=Heliocybe sulcata TaxID=5364 RepID=A0A5C3MJP5_9AGAM|nr:cyclin-like protein [Heliocybe sulcata]